MLKRLKQFKLYVKFSKCIFMISQVEFLKYIVERNEIAMNSSRMNVIRTWFILITLREFQVFLKFVNFYKRFMKKFARITRLMTKLLKDNKQEKQNEFFVFNVNIVKTFRKLLKTFIEILMLIHFDSKDKIRIKTNVFEFVIVTILS